MTTTIDAYKNITMKIFQVQLLRHTNWKNDDDGDNDDEEELTS